MCWWGRTRRALVADAATAAQFAELGIILLMFGVGLHFHLQDLLAVGAIAVSGAIIQISAATLASMIILHFFGFSLLAGAVFGMAISVASTVVLTRVLADNHVLHTHTGHVALGWLVVEDIFTILLLVLLPAVFAPGGEFWSALGSPCSNWAPLPCLPWWWGKSSSRFFWAMWPAQARATSFTLDGHCPGPGHCRGRRPLFVASMALGAFLAGMVVGQSEFSARAAAEALPARRLCRAFLCFRGHAFQSGGFADGPGP